MYSAGQHSIVIHFTIKAPAQVDGNEPEKGKGRAEKNESKDAEKGGKGRAGDKDDGRDPKDRGGKAGRRGEASAKPKKDEKEPRQEEAEPESPLDHQFLARFESPRLCGKYFFPKS